MLEVIEQNSKFIAQEVCLTNLVPRDWDAGWWKEKSSNTGTPSEIYGYTEARKGRMINLDGALKLNSCGGHRSQVSSVSLCFSPSSS